ncbi:hypothetical protein Cgig2_003868 [Carnegiea gigantea]|uniref:Uncharacterized protein n=1 Tax=Carnegiea gigantea TaxID=171969 RepID=A0A9Q1K2Z9_9CARY|nr:hypothetical protein Cgig2_003868 [Carnegiea gigantea]
MDFIKQEVNFIDKLLGSWMQKLEMSHLFFKCFAKLTKTLIRLKSPLEVEHNVTRRKNEVLTDHLATIEAENKKLQNHVESVESEMMRIKNLVFRQFNSRPSSTPLDGHETPGDAFQGVVVTEVANVLHTKLPYCIREKVLFGIVRSIAKETSSNATEMGLEYPTTFVCDGIALHRLRAPRKDTLAGMKGTIAQVFQSMSVLALFLALEAGLGVEAIVAAVLDGIVGAVGDEAGSRGGDGGRGAEAVGADDEAGPVWAGVMGIEVGAVVASAEVVEAGNKAGVVVGIVLGVGRRRGEGGGGGGGRQGGSSGGRRGEGGGGGRGRGGGGHRCINLIGWLVVLGCISPINLAIVA